MQKILKCLLACRNPPNGKCLLQIQEFFVFVPTFLKTSADRSQLSRDTICLIYSSTGVKILVPGSNPENR